MKTQKINTPAVLFAVCTFACGSTTAMADEFDQAKRIHERLTGVTPTQTDLITMRDMIDAGNVEDAAMFAIDDGDNSHNFYNVTLKNWATPWTNEEFDVFQPLNDYSATVIGLVRDEADFRDLLIGDIAYVGTGVTPAYSITSNAHYEALEDQNVDLGDPTNFVATTQSSLNGLPSDATAGVMTSRAAAKSFFYLGTNRAMFRFTAINHLCTDLEQLNDVSIDPGRIRQDVSRSPGGDSRVFLNNCLGCHAGMDPLAQAFAYYDYSFDGDPETGQITYNDVGDLVDTDVVTGTRVTPKHHINSATFPYGYVIPDDSWENFWREGQNQSIGWNYTGDAPDGFGSGAKSLGEELANTEAFAYCQVEKAFETVCLREPQDNADRSEVDTLVSEFQSSTYNMKQVFAGAAAYCMGE